MAPYRRKTYNFWRKRRPYQTRFRYRKWRPRTTFRRNRRRRRVRRNRYFKNYFRRYHRKLKKLPIKQWQPNNIVKCKIIGLLQLFGAGKGRFSHNFTTYKESYVNAHEAGGGGWSVQQLTLGNLYTQNEYLMNWWTKSNRSLPLCRYLGSKFTLYRQQETDYIFTYDIEQPFSIGKYYYPSLHPIRMLNYNKKVLVPSMKTAPHRRKPYVKVRIKPLKELKNQWYFQQLFAKQPLVQFATIACSLNSMFQATNALNNNITLYYLNVAFFQNPQFNFPETSSTGYISKPNQYIYGFARAAVPPEDTQIQYLIYLANTKLNDEGDEIGQASSQAQYGPAKWGNPFYFRYLNGDYPSFITDKPLSWFLDKTKTKKLKELKSEGLTYTFKSEPYILSTRYNPNYDKGHGNLAYWIRNDDATQKNYEPPNDPDLKIENFPLWILLWGWEEYTRYINKAKNLSQDYMLCVRTSYLRNKSTTYVFLSDTYVRGQGPYNVDYADLPLQDISHWYPRYRYQQEAIESILETGPGVCKSETQLSIQAHMRYVVSFKWGGNKTTMENVYDPFSQPTYPTPGNQQLLNEITSPTTDIQSFIYNWDIRRDLLTQNAAKRITEISLFEPTMFTDGTKTGETPSETSKTQEKTAAEKEKETLLLQLFQLQQQNINLRDRFRQLMEMYKSL